MGYGSMIYYCLTGLWFMNVHEYGVWLGVFWTYTIISGHGWQNEMLFDQGSFKVDTINFHSTRSLTWKRIIIFVLNRSETAETTFCTFMYFRVKNETGYNHNRRLFCFEMTVHFFTKVQFSHSGFFISYCTNHEKMENFRKVFLKKSFQKSFKNFIKNFKKIGKIFKKKN